VNACKCFGRSDRVRHNSFISYLSISYIVLLLALPQRHLKHVHFVTCSSLGCFCVTFGLFFGHFLEFLSGCGDTLMIELYIVYLASSVCQFDLIS